MPPFSHTATQRYGRDAVTCRGAEPARGGSCWSYRRKNWARARRFIGPHGNAALPQQNPGTIPARRSSTVQPPWRARLRATWRRGSGLVGRFRGKPALSTAHPAAGKRHSRPAGAAAPVRCWATLQAAAAACPVTLASPAAASARGAVSVKIQTRRFGGLLPF